MSELTTWLLECIAEDEAVARGLNNWMTFETPFLRLYDDDPEYQDEFDAKDHAKTLARLLATHGIPARVLAECAAKRRIVEAHACDFIGSWQWCKTCADWDAADYDGPPHADYPCPTLRALASVYGGADGFQEAWRV